MSHHYHHHHYYINGILIIILVHLNRTSTSNSLPINSQGPQQSPFSSSSSSSSYTLFDSLAPHLSNLKLSQNIATESASVSQRIIQTKYGSIRGSIVKLSSNSRSTASHHSSSSQVSSFIDLPDVETYLGVPYATPPTGGLRFMPPVTPTHWRGVRLVNRLRPVCPQQIPQRDYRAILSGNETEALRLMPRARYEYLRRLIPMLGNQSEDCLYLNIYVPFSASSSSSTAPNNVRSSENNKHAGSSGGYPVLVLLHGESYDWHSGSIFDGSILSSYGQVIVITVNYRLGILGFLPAFTDGTIRGNYGLMDQVAALHWIQENIGEFGGQPSNVTLIGHGHGASLAHLLMLSPMAKGLFNRVILMSGSALSPWAIARDPEHYARSLGQKLNCTNLETMIDCLRTKKIGQLLAKYENSAPEHLTAFGPIIDSIVVPYDPFHLYQTELYHSSSPSNTASFGSSSSHTSKDLAKRNQTIGSVVSSSGGGSSSSFISGFDPLSLARSYDLMVGVTDADSPCIFSDQESMYGLEPERRDRVLRTLVRNLYDYHQQAIFLILYNEYSAWSPSFNSVINDNDDDSHSHYNHNAKRSFDILNSATSILSDALVFAPLVRTMDSHAQPSFPQSSTYFYRFDTNKVSQESLYSDNNRYSSSSSFLDQSAPQQQHLPPSQRLICSVGHDLAFLFGDPIAHLQLGVNSQVGPFYYPVNLTRTHQIVSELFMQYIVNFARDGDPNISRNSHFVKSPPSNPTSRQLIKSSLTQRQYWPKYDPQHKNFMALGSTVPKPLDERKNHRLSLWLNLIPRLLIDDQEFFRTNFGANLTDDKKNALTRYQYYSRKNFPNSAFPNYTSTSDNRRGHYLSNSRESIGHQNSQAETSKHVAGSMAMASGPYPSQQQQQQEQEQQKHLYRQHHLLVDYDNPKSYDGIVRTFSNDTTIVNQSSVNHSLGESADFSGNYSNNPGNSSTTVWYHHNGGIWNVTHNPMNSTNLENQQDRILQSRHEPTAFMNSHPNSFNGSTSWLIIIGSACALLFFINVIFFITLFYQLRKNRKSANSHNSAMEKTTESIKTSEPSSLLNQSPIFVASNNHKYRDPMQTTATSMGNHNNNLVDQDLMIQLHSGNATLNRKHANDNSRHTVNSFTELYATSGGGREQHRLQQPPQSISFQLTPSDTTLQRNKTLSFPVNSNPNNTQKSPHTILLNDPNDLVSNNPENYVPFMTNDPSNEPNTSQHQPTTYYCLQMNPNNDGLNNFDLNLTNQNNPNNDPSTMISNNHNNTGIQLQHQSNQSSTSATYREMSV